MATNTDYDYAYLYNQFELNYEMRWLAEDSTRMGKTVLVYYAKQLIGTEAVMFDSIAAALTYAETKIIANNIIHLVECLGETGEMTSPIEN